MSARHSDDRPDSPPTDASLRFEPQAREPLVATPLRWAASSAVLIGATLAIARGYSAWSHTDWTALPFLTAVAAACAAESMIVLALLRAEESRLARGLRVARTGTPLLRGTIARRRRQRTLLGRLASTDLGVAAVLLAEGDEAAARDVLAAEPPWMDVGRLSTLRAIVLADVERTSATPRGRRHCIERLTAIRSLRNREANLYRAHVLVKAVLEEGDADAAFDLAARLGTSADQDERIYAAWLRVWFDLDGEGDWPPLADQDARLAVLLARSHGAEKLVDKLEARRVGIARTPLQE